MKVNTKRRIFDAKKYNFSEDELYQRYLKSRPEYNHVSRKDFHRFGCKCEREYIRILNNRVLRTQNEIPEVWGYQFIVD